MTTIEIVDSESRSQNGLALIEVSGAVWYTFSRPWWDISSWFWWWLTPGQKKWVFVRKASGQRVRIRAVKLTDKHIRLGRKE